MPILDVMVDVSTGSKKTNNLVEWQTPSKTFSAPDIVVTLSDSAKALISEEKCLKYINDQYHIADANASRREKTGGGPARLPVDGVKAALVAMYLATATGDTDEARLADATAKADTFLAAVPKK